MRRIKHLRLLSEKSQREVATRTNIPQAHLCYFESGRMTPRPEELVRLGKFFNCPPERLLDHVAPTGLPDGAEAKDSARERATRG